MDKKPNRPGDHGSAQNLHAYWTQDPEGLAKWANAEHPWTELHKHLLKHMDGNDKMAKATAAKWYHDVFHHWPGEQNQFKPGKDKGRSCSPDFDAFMRKWCAD